jgi:Domain of Unknown Function with PDB structure (DUF3857)/Transglutaminase-like superfamily
MKKMLQLILLFAPSFLFAQYNSALNIPDSLTSRANAVKRFEELTIEIKSPGKAIVNQHQIFTILDETGSNYASYFSYYNKFIGLNWVTGILYDKSGKELKRIKKKDMEDMSGTGDMSLMTDTRFKANNFYYKIYPYTVDYQEEDEINGMMFLDDWFPQNEPKLSVQYSKYVIIAPKDYIIRFKQFNLSGQPTITENGDKKIYTWEIKNLPAKTKERFAPDWEKITPFVMIAPSDFEMDGYKGNMTSWKNFGAFLYQLAKGRDVLPDAIKTKVHELTDHITDEKQKISILYNFLQKNTRYISVQLGIGGWQPFDAGYVANKGYGDCKALSNYMVALLKEAGINGKNVVIRAERNAREVVDDFSCPQFNHEIACVPMGKDTVWLECTDHELPAGYLSSFTSDRWGLLIDETGGTLVHTPKYGLNENLQCRSINATINDEGNLMATINTNYKAEQQDALELDLEYKSKDDMLKDLKNKIDLPTYDVSKFEYKEQKNHLPPSVDESLELTASNYAQVSGRRLFINPNILNRSDEKLKKLDERKYNVELREEYRDIDSVEIRIPAGYQPEAVPGDMMIKSKFGKYVSHVIISNDKIIYYRNNEQYSGDFPASDYASLVDYYDQIYKADRAKVVLVKKE